MNSAINKEHLFIDANMADEQTIIRMATIEDIPATIDFVENYSYKELHWKHVAFSRSGLQATLEMLITQDKGCVILATKANEIIGYALCFINRYFFSDESYASDLTFHVKKEARGAFVGKKLIRAMRDFAVKKGAKELLLTINSGVEVEQTERLLTIMGAKKLGTSMTIRFS
jgi:ribosomal protein S18 acetylase RimI-like enzyme